ncbi:hypothetical protein ABK040_014882 [Willaertia magna]
MSEKLNEKPIKTTLSKNPKDLTTLLKDEKNKLYIPDQQINHHTSPFGDFEIYLSEISRKGGLMLGKSINISGEIKDTSSTTIWPYFIKFTKENIPISLQNDEYIEFISCGLQHLIISTNFSKCYLFGDFHYESNFSENGFHFGKVLNFKLNENIKNKLNCKITNLDCGEQYVIVKDELNRFWYAGKLGFGNGSKFTFDFLQLDGGELTVDLNNENFKKITKVVSGGRHVAVCLNDKFIYTIGNNYHNQLGFGNSSGRKVKYSGITDDVKGFSFVKVNWNLNEEYCVKELVCSGNSTVILTKCGKLFKTMQTENGHICSVKLLKTTNRQPITLASQWSSIEYFTKDEKIYSIGDYDVDLNLNTDIKKESLFSSKHYNEMKLHKGTTSSYFACFIEREAKITKKNTEEIVNLKTNLPIIHIKISGEILVVFCFRKVSTVMQLKLFKTNGLFDIDFLF